MTDDSSQPAGWYPTPDGTQRYWDGQQWTEHTAPSAGTTSSYGVSNVPAAKSSSTAKVLIPIGACVALAVIAVVIAALAGGGEDDDEARVTTSTQAPTTADDAGDATEASESTSTTSEAEDTTTSTTAAPPEADGSQSSPLEIGTGTRVGDYEVTVTSVDFDATEAVRSENQFNEPPSNGAYAVVTMNVTYVGDEEGNPDFDLAAVLQGGNGRQYSDSECGAVFSDSLESPTLTNGGNLDVRFCWNYAPEAVDGATMFVEPLFSFSDEDRVYWTV